MNPYAQRDAEYFAEIDREAERDRFIESYFDARYDEIMASPQLIAEVLDAFAESMTLDEITDALAQTATQQYRMIDRNVRRVVELEADAAANNRNTNEDQE